jgi:glyoxylase-like metal-dependent hydrolase (beta-lactamase superfamily II)
MIETIEYGDVLQIKLRRDREFTSVSCYLVDDLLIDTGPAYTAQELAEFLRTAGIKKVINTHHHEDHIAANRFLQERYEVEIFAPPLAVDKINKPAELFPYQEDVWGYPVPSQVKLLGPSISTGEYTLEVIPTPGHDRDHVCLFEREQGWLFSGDAYTTSRPVVCRPMEDQRQIIEDLKMLRSLEPTILFPAPTRVIMDPLDTLDKTIEYLEDLGGRIEDLHHKGMTPEEIRQQIFGEEGPMAELTQQQFSSINMVKSFLSVSI